MASNISAIGILKDLYAGDTEPGIKDPEFAKAFGYTHLGKDGIYYKNANTMRDLMFAENPFMKMIPKQSQQGAYLPVPLDYEKIENE